MYNLINKECISENHREVQIDHEVPVCLLLSANCQSLKHSACSALLVLQYLLDGSLQQLSQCSCPSVLWCASLPRNPSVNVYHICVFLYVTSTVFSRI
jgi:hypothetical protein